MFKNSSPLKVRALLVVLSLLTLSDVAHVISIVHCIVKCKVPSDNALKHSARDKPLVNPWGIFLSFLCPFWSTTHLCSSPVLVTWRGVSFQLSLTTSLRKQASHGRSWLCSSWEIKLNVVLVARVLLYFLELYTLRRYRFDQSQWKHLLRSFRIAARQPVLI